MCFACRVVSRRLGLPLAPVLPVRLCPLPGPLYAVLMGYKESPVDEARCRFTVLVRALLDGFLSNHAPCVTALGGGPPEVVLPVPSSARPAGSPLIGVAGLDADVRRHLHGARWSPGLLGRGQAKVGHMRPDGAAFIVNPATPAEVVARRALLLDDTYVSGARAQSAAAALRRAGARSVVIVAVGRVLRPDRVPAHAAFLRRAARDETRDGGGDDAGSGRPCARCVQADTPTE